DAEAARVRGGRDQAGARHPAHAGLHDGVLDADQVGQGGAQPRCRCVHVDGTSFSRIFLGSSTSRMMRSCSGVGSGVTGASARPAISKEVFSATSSGVTPGCRLRARMEWPGPSKSKTPRLVTTRWIFRKRKAGLSGATLS